MRINQFLAKSGLGSRRECEKFVLEKRVKLNGKILLSLAQQVDPDKDVVQVDGSPVQMHLDKEYFIINKPIGVVTTVKDPQNRPTVMELLQSVTDARLFPVGRLDANSEGLILLTNDGELSHRLMHPRFHVKKKYVVHIHGYIPEWDLDKLRSGIPLEEGMTQKAIVEDVRNHSDFTTFNITITQGWNRQIRRMVEHLGYKVIRLIRIQFGTVFLGHLASGGYRKLTEKELKSLQKSVQLL